MKSKNASKILFMQGCENCGNSLEDGWNFCPFCNNKIDYYPCPNCGNKISQLWHYCPFCKNEVKFNIENSYINSNEWLTQILKNN